MIFVQPIGNLLPDLFFPSFHSNIASRQDNGNNKTKECRNPSMNHKAGRPIEEIKFQVRENDKSFHLDLEVPGVKRSGVKVEMIHNNVLQVSAERMSGSQTSIKYFQRFAVDDKSVNTTDVKAELEDGILTISMSKKQPGDPVVVKVDPTCHPENEAKKADTGVASLDLPGVKHGDLEVKYHEGIIYVTAKRSHGKNSILIRKKVVFDENRFDTTKLKAYLADGVLVLTAPRIVIMDKSSTDQSGVRAIEVTDPISGTATPVKVLPLSEEKSVEPGMEKSNLNVDKTIGEKESTEVIVETVEENVEAMEHENEWISLVK
jgi:HSP20 family molecular chaperone IbpA